jgi:hypothetical protein
VLEKQGIARQRCGRSVGLRIPEEIADFCRNLKAEANLPNMGQLRPQI